MTGVFLGGDRVSVLTDHFLSSCITLSDNFLATQSVVTFVLKKPYDNSVEVLVHGRGMRCELAPKTCRGGFVTAVFQQGRHSEHPCMDLPTPCPTSEICTPLGMTSRDDAVVTCRYRCKCPLAVGSGGTSCETILFSIGRGALSHLGGDIEICSFNVE